MDQNPTVRELVLAEDDRLALLEHRLNRLKTKLLRQQREIQSFLRMQGKIIFFLYGSRLLGVIYFISLLLSFFLRIRHE